MSSLPSIGQTLGQYRIVEKIGAGGMGVVYRAHDDRLDRDVAIKVLPAGTLADEAARKRFRKEALALSKLNHSNIETVYEFDTQDGVDFLVMEYVPGATLGQKLAAGALPEKEVAALGTQLAAALEEAHEHSVVHRDLKPANIAVTPRGQMKVLDFGLARLMRPLSAATTESLTETQVAAGTLPYMAPEQLRAEPADARSDIYGAGAVLYEMATGQRAFREEVASRLVDAILHQPPVQPRALNARVTPELERIILKCLEKEPENRYQSAKELGVDLRRLAAPTAISAPAAVRPRVGQRAGLAAGAIVLLAVLGVAGYLARERFWPHAKPPAGKIMLAVLPFENLSGNPEQEYFSDGLTEEMIAQLSRLQPQRLGVIARTSAMRYKHTDKGIPQIGQELGVAYILEGSVRRAAGRVRITAQLIQVSDQTHLWAENYEQPLADVLAIQSEVAGRIASSLAVELLPAQRAQLTSPRPVNPEAHEAYLKGRYYLTNPTEEMTKKAIEQFNHAIEIDRGYAPAYAGLAQAYYILSNLRLPPKEAMPKVRSAALKALELDDTLVAAHTSLALVKAYYDWDWSGAERELKRAIDLDPGSASAHYSYVRYLAVLGRYDEAIAEAKRALELDPVSLAANGLLAEAFNFARQYDRAIEQAQKTLELDPNYFLAHWNLGWAYEEKRMYNEAIQEYQKTILLGGGPVAQATLAHAYAVSGNRDAARKLLDELKLHSQRSFVPAADIALIYVGLGEKDQAFAWLEKAYEQRAEGLVGLKVDRRFDPLRSDPRFQDLLRRVGLLP